MGAQLSFNKKVWSSKVVYSLGLLGYSRSLRVLSLRGRAVPLYWKGSNNVYVLNISRNNKGTREQGVRLLSTLKRRGEEGGAYAINSYGTMGEGDNIGAGRKIYRKREFFKSFISFPTNHTFGSLSRESFNKSRLG